MGSELSRRRLMGAMVASAVLAGCGTRGTPGQTTTTQDPNDRTITWANWTLYLDYDRKTRSFPSLESFQQESGYTVEYREDIDDNVSFNGKVGPQLARGMDIGYDLVTPSDSLIAPWIAKGWATPLDKANIPNAKNLLPELENVAFDPGRVYSLTYQSGFGGLVWNKDRVPNGLRTVDDLWAPELKGKVVVLSEVQDTVGLMMLAQGVDIDKPFTAEQFMNALAVVEEQVDSGQIKQVKGNSYKEDLINEQAWAAIGWSGDIFQINAEEGDKWGFALPDTGGTLWSDNFLIPSTATNKAGAEALIDYYYRPDVAAQVAAWVNYMCPVNGAQEILAKTDPDLAKSEWIFPTEKLLSQAQVFRDFTPQEEMEYTEAFGRVVQA